MAWQMRKTLAAEVRALYEKWQGVLQQMAFLQNSEQERLRNMDWLKFQLDEIDKVKLRTRWKTNPWRQSTPCW